MEGGRGAEDREKMGPEVYGKREKRGREAQEKGKNHATFCNISKSKKCKEAGTNKYRAGTGIKLYGKGKIKPSSPPQLITEKEIIINHRKVLLSSFHLNCHTLRFHPKSNSVWEYTVCFVCKILNVSDSMNEILLLVAGGTSSFLIFSSF